jgi:enterochelin esterase family protein
MDGVVMRTRLLLALEILIGLHAGAPPWRTDRLSPRIAALANQAKDGGTAAVENFWHEMRTRGTPLVETLPDDPTHVLLTFLYRSSTAKGVILTAQLTTSREPILLDRLPGTDVWYKTYWIANDMRFSYGLAESSAGRPGRDALNPKSLEIAGGIGPSVVAPAAAPVQQGFLPQSAIHGKLVEERIASKILNTERSAWVYVPAGYNPKRAEPYPVLICFDGRLYIDAIPVPAILENLVTAGEILPMMAIFIRQLPQPMRNFELGNNAPFADFVATELLPYIRSKWHTTSDPARTVVCGSSAGGLAAVFFALHRPDLFGNVLAQSAALWPGITREDPEHEWVIRQYETARKLNVRFVLQPGLLEVVRTPLDGPPILDSNRHLRDVLKSKGYAVYYTEVAGGHEPIAWRDGIAPGLIELLGRRKESK